MRSPIKYKNEILSEYKKGVAPKEICQIYNVKKHFV